MIELWYQKVDFLLGLSKTDLSFLNMICRAFIAYFLGIILFVLNRRFSVERTSFDIILKLMLGSAFASAILGGVAYFPTLGMICFIVFLNWLLSVAAFHIRCVEKLIKGDTDVLYKDGVIQWDAMKRHYITEEELNGALRKKSVNSLDTVDTIYFEKNGEISILQRKNK